MNFDDFGGAVAGTAGGLVHWGQDGRSYTTSIDRLTALLTSAACGCGFGFVAQAVVEWQWPNLPKTVGIGAGFVVGLASGVLSQFVVGFVSAALARVQGRLLDRIAPTGQPSDGNRSNAGAEPKPDKPAHPVGGAVADDGHVRDVARAELREPGGGRGAGAETGD